MKRGDAVELTRQLVRVDSRNPSLVKGAPGEAPVARLLAELLREWGFSVEIMEVQAGRVNVIARTGVQGGRSIMFNGHLDVVGTDGMVHPPFEGTITNGRLFGRGATDMKGGVAAMCAAAARATDRGIAGEIIICAVCDEEYRSIGTSALVQSGVRADAAIVTEPTRLAISPAHKGFVWFTITVKGRAAHGSRYDVGVDAIRHAGHLLTALDDHEATALVKRTHPLLGRASLHASLIEGGTALSVYPDSCVLRLERRTLPGEKAEDTMAQMHEVCRHVRERIPDFHATVEMEFAQDPSEVANDAPVVRELAGAMLQTGEAAPISGLSAWTDAALLNNAGIPAICYGPGDIALAHAAEEYVEVAEVERATAVLDNFAMRWLAGTH